MKSQNINRFGKHKDFLNPELHTQFWVKKYRAFPNVEDSLALQ